MAVDASPAEALDLRRQAAEQFLCSGHFDRGKALISEVLGEVGVSEPRSAPTLLARLMMYRALLRVRGYRFRERDVTRVEPRTLARVDALRSAGAGFSMSDLVRGACFQAQATLAALDKTFKPGVTQGDRYAAPMMARLGL
jgi:hypothetical protein